MRAHVMDVDAAADACARIAREIQIRHRIRIKRIVRRNIVGKMGRLKRRHLALAYAADHILHHLTHRHLRQIRKQRLRHRFARDIALHDKVADECLLQLFGVKRLRQLVHVVDDLHAVFAQQIRERVMLLLCDLQIRNVVEQEPCKIIRHQPVDLVADAVQQNLIQLADLGKITDSGNQRFTPFRNLMFFTLPLSYAT